MHAYEAQTVCGYTALAFVRQHCLISLGAVWTLRRAPCVSTGRSTRDGVRVMLLQYTQIKDWRMTLVIFFDSECFLIRVNVVVYMFRTSDKDGKLGLWRDVSPFQGSQTEEAPERAKRLSTIPISRLSVMFSNKFFPLLNHLVVYVKLSSSLFCASPSTVIWYNAVDEFFWGVRTKLILAAIAQATKCLFFHGYLCCSVDHKEACVRACVCVCMRACLRLCVWTRSTLKMYIHVHIQDHLIWKSSW